MARPGEEKLKRTAQDYLGGLRWMWRSSAKAKGKIPKRQQEEPGRYLPAALRRTKNKIRQRNRRLKEALNY